LKTPANKTLTNPIDRHAHVKDTTT